jgi:Beta-lactamase enzyme family
LASATSRLAALVAACLLCLGGPATPRADIARRPETAPLTAKSPPGPPLPTLADVARARGFAGARQGLVSFAVVGTDHRLHCYRCWRPCEAASVVKAMLLVAYLDRLARERPITASDRRVLRPMIRVSDNKAATAIYERLGDAALYRLARRAGMKSFVVRGYWGSAQTTARDQARFFAQLDRLTPPRYRRYARSLLSSIVSWKTWGIPEIARPTWRVFFKDGWRPSSTGHLVHQVALLERGQRAIAIAVLTDRNPSHRYGRDTVRGIAARLLRP